MPDARRECYTRLIDYMYASLQDFYVANPDFYKQGTDPRAINAIAASRDGLAGMLAILDEYEIERKATGAE